MADSIENNEVKHRGVKPAVGQDSIRVYNRIPDSLTQIQETGFALNGNSTIYTVPSLKTFYLLNVDYSISNYTEGAGLGYVYIYDSTPTVIYRVAYLKFISSGIFAGHPHYNQPLELSAGSYIYIYSDSLNLFVSCSVHGYER
jgi:hypothetical protein